MRVADSLVSVGLPVRNGIGRMERVVNSVLAQDHERIELVISDNDSTDDTEQYCRELARADERVVYHRQPRDIGMLNNFIATMQLASGPYFRWIGDDDWAAPHSVSRSLELFAADERLMLVTTQVAYTGEDGLTQTDAYTGTRLLSDDPVERFAEFLRLLNTTHLVIDPLYGLMRREPALAIARRNMLREDEVFAAKLALVGPWGHVPEVLAHRFWKSERMPLLARRLEVPAWQARFATTLECLEIWRWLRQAGLTPAQRRRAEAAVAKMYLLRQRTQAVRRGRKLARLASGLVAPTRTASR